VSEEEVSRLRSNLLNLDKHLGPYPFEHWKKWKGLVDQISGNINLLID
jgi:A1 cistron-splicing factor AAR2